MTQDTKVDWGAPIAGIRMQPDWLADDTLVNGVYRSDALPSVKRFSGAVDPARDWVWSQVASFRLPADHPYYTQPTPTNEVRERMEALTRRIADDKHETVPAWFVDLYDEARAIVALLDPVDGDLLAARRYYLTKQPHDEKAIMAGERDHTGCIRNYLAGLKDGRALAEAGK